MLGILSRRIGESIDVGDDGAEGDEENGDGDDGVDNDEDDGDEESDGGDEDWSSDDEASVVFLLLIPDSSFPILPSFVVM